MPADGVGRASLTLCATRRSVAVAAALALVAGCGTPANPAGHGAGREAGATLRIELRSPGDAAGSSTVDLLGLPPRHLSAVREAALTPDEWSAMLRVSVAGIAEDVWSRPPVLGAYAVTDDTIRFSPRYPFDPGRSYRVIFEPAHFPERLDELTSNGWSHGLDVIVTEPAADVQPTTTVVRVYPTGDLVPENLLRLYVYFSAPMGLRGGVDYVRILDADGQLVEDAFLPLDVALWNRDRTRYTLLLDPGRVKRRILPNEQMGRAITMGRTYTLVLERDWRDASGLPLVESFSRQFRVGPPQDLAIDLARWQIAAPVAGTRDPLVVSFPRPLDYALLQRTLLVATDRGELVDGEIDVEAAETQWIFTPHVPWRSGEYHVTALPDLEDPAGNRVGRPFEFASPASSERAAPPRDVIDSSVSFFPRPR